MWAEVSLQSPTSIGCRPSLWVCASWQSMQVPTRFPPVLVQGFTPKPRISHLHLIHSILAHWFRAQGTSLSRWFEHSSGVLSMCFVSGSTVSLKVMNSPPCCAWAQRAVEQSVRSAGLGSVDPGSNSGSFVHSACSPRTSVSHLGNGDESMFLREPV